MTPIKAALNIQPVTPVNPTHTESTLIPAEIERYLWDSSRVLRALGGWCAERLRASGVQVDPPVGGFCLFADLREQAAALAARGIETSAEFCENLLEEAGVAVLPGVEFGRPAEELTARLAYVDFDGARTLEAVAHPTEDAARDERFLRTFCPSVTIAIDRMIEWIEGKRGPTR